MARTAATERARRAARASGGREKTAPASLAEGLTGISTALTGVGPSGDQPSRNRASSDRPARLTADV
jgi:hypothetical protein